MRPDSGLLPGHEMYYIHAKLCLVFQNEEFLGENLCTVDATCSAFFFCSFFGAQQLTPHAVHPDQAHSTIHSPNFQKKNQKKFKRGTTRGGGCMQSIQTKHLSTMHIHKHLSTMHIQPLKTNTTPKPKPQTGISMR